MAKGNHLFCALFDSRAQADDAIDAVAQAGGGVGVDAVRHEGHVNAEELQMAGTRGVSGLVVGGLAVGLVGALLANFVLLPMTGMSTSFAQFIFIGTAGSIFGIIAGLLAGSSTESATLSSYEDELARGRVLLTLKSQDVSEANLRSILERCGAERIALI